VPEQVAVVLDIEQVDPPKVAAVIWETGFPTVTVVDTVIKVMA
jgi:hypothetical protein